MYFMYISILILLVGTLTLLIKTRFEPLFSSSVDRLSMVDHDICMVNI